MFSLEFVNNAKLAIVRLWRGKINSTACFYLCMEGRSSTFSKMYFACSLAAPNFFSFPLKDLNLQRLKYVNNQGRISLWLPRKVQDCEHKYISSVSYFLGHETTCNQVNCLSLPRIILTCRSLSDAQLSVCSFKPQWWMIHVKLLHMKQIFCLFTFFSIS